MLDKKLGTAVKSSTESFESMVGVVGVPTILIVHPDGLYISVHYFILYYIISFFIILPFSHAVLNSKLATNICNDHSLRQLNPNLINCNRLRCLERKILCL